MLQQSKLDSMVPRLRRSLLWLAVLPVLLGFGVLLVQSIGHERDRLYDQYQRRISRVTLVIEQILTHADLELGLSQRLGDFSRLPAQQQERWLFELLHHDEFFNSIAYLDERGQERAFVSRLQAGAQRARQWSGQDAVQQAQSTRAMTYGAVRVDPTTGEPSLLVVQPLFKPHSSEVAGLMAAELSLKQIWTTLREQARGTVDELFVLDQGRRIIAHLDPSQAMAGRFFTTMGPVGIGRDLHGGLALVASSTLSLPGNELVAVVTRPASSAFSLVIVQLVTGLIVALLALLMALWLQRRISNQLVLPIEDLTEAARRITAGETHIRMPEHFEAELATLARAFNIMLDRLGHEQDKLEQRVAQRAQDQESMRQQAQQANRMLLTVLDTIPVRIFWKDRNLVYLGCNHLFARDVGKSEPQEVLGQTDYELVSSEAADRYRADDARVIHSGESKLGHEELRNTADGHARWTRMSKVPLCNAQGEIIGVLGTYEDITQYKRIEAESRAAKEAAETASHAKSLFLSRMSHELRTPLNEIMGHAQLMEMMPGGSGEVHASSKEIRRAGAMLLSLVNDILDLARVEAGHMNVPSQTVSLSGVLAECLSQNANMARNRQITLAQAGSCTGLFVTADARRLLQVLNNLVSNAIKYNRSAGRVDLSCSRPTVGWIRIEVKDTGPGLTDQQQANLFHPFNRLGAELSSTEGAGIGLVLSRRLMEAMKGVMGVKSQRGEGSTFWLELPEAQVASPPDKAVRPVAHRLKLLVAEDYEPNQMILRRQIEALGHQADIVADGSQALQQWRQEHYDLILTDLNMPVMDGLELARTIRREEQNTGAHMTVIGITASTEDAEIQKCRNAGMDEVLPKPINLNNLRELLARWEASAPAQGVPPMSVVQAAAPLGEPMVLDVSQLYRILGSVHSEQAQELLRIFLDTAGEGLRQLAAITQDSQTLAREMHKQKSSARTVGAQRYAALTESLEQQAKSGDPGAVGAWLGELQRELERVRAEAGRMVTATGNTPALPAANVAAMPTIRMNCRTVLLVDDDPVVIRQLSTLLQRQGVEQVLTASNGIDAIEVASRQGRSIDVLVSDLSMPTMDGVELIRRFGQSGFTGSVILMSGADLPILRTVHELAVMQGLHVLGEIRKPVLPQELTALLDLREQAPQPKRLSRRAPDFTADTIRTAIDRKEFTVWFQPKVDARSLLPLGVEALARWQQADGGFVPPDLFITVAERDGMIADLSRQLLSQALRGAMQLRQAGHPLTLAVNVSGRWLDDLDLPGVILNEVLASGLNPSELVLEVTETGVMEDLTTALDVLTRLRLKGFGLAIDDFGIGYSSFEQLGRIPFTEMKLDRSFVNKGSRHIASRAILESSMGMAQKLGLFTVAEGVETEADLELVRSLGCDSVQGYLIAKPMPVDELLVWLAAAGRQ
jgi:PAS domain S-box-containing protein